VLLKKIRPKQKDDAKGMTPGLPASSFDGGGGSSPSLLTRLFFWIFRETREGGPRHPTSGAAKGSTGICVAGKAASCAMDRSLLARHHPSLSLSLSLSAWPWPSVQLHRRRRTTPPLDTIAPLPSAAAAAAVAVPPWSSHSSSFFFLLPCSFFFVTSFPSPTEASLAARARTVPDRVTSNAAAAVAQSPS
jgi:hypothetical protein